MIKMLSFTGPLLLLWEMGDYYKKGAQIFLMDTGLKGM